MDEMTETVFDLLVMHTQMQAYRTMTLALLGKAPDHALEHLRGMARIGLDTPPEDEDAKEMHGALMEVLERLGIEPMSEDELDAQMATALAELRARQKGGSGPTLVQ